MILKRMDETILAGQYDLEDSDEVTVVLIAPELKMGSDNKLVVDWNEVNRNTVSKKHLFYDDTADLQCHNFQSGAVGHVPSEPDALHPFAGAEKCRHYF